MHMHYSNISELINDKDLRVLLIFRFKQYVVGIFQIRLGKAISIIVNNNYSTANTEITLYQFNTKP